PAVTRRAPHEIDDPVLAQLSVAVERWIGELSDDVGGVDPLLEQTDRRVATGDVVPRLGVHRAQPGGRAVDPIHAAAGNAGRAGAADLSRRTIHGGDRI